MVSSVGLLASELVFSRYLLDVTAVDVLNIYAVMNGICAVAVSTDPLRGTLMATQPGDA